MENANFNYKIDIEKNYTDIMILLNSKEKLESFINHFIMFLVLKNEKDKEEKGEDFLPSFIHNEKGKSLEVDYNLFILALEDWVKNLGYEEYKSISKKFKFHIAWGLSNPSNANIFLIANLFGMYHKITKTGVSSKFGTPSQSHLFCAPMVFKIADNGLAFQYNSVSFYLSKIEKIIEENEYNTKFYEYLEYTKNNIEQVAYGTKNVIDFWGNDDVLLYLT